MGRTCGAYGRGMLGKHVQRCPGDDQGVTRPSSRLQASPPFFCSGTSARHSLPIQLQSLILRFHFKCIKLSDEEAEKIRKSTLSLTRPKTDGADDYVCQDCQEATGKKTTSESNVLLTPLTSFCRIRVYSHYPIMSSPTYTLLLRILLVGLVCSAILYAGFHVHGFWIAVSVFCV
jgi:hypothetical protein